MARFFDSVDSRELRKVEQLLRKNGIKYAVLIAGQEGPVHEVTVAEEDLVYADLLLSNLGRGSH
jgi:hypothetical protein